LKNLTAQQIAVVLAIQAGSSISVRSVAGSGKTSTLVAAHQTSNPPRTLCVAFNKRNAEDLAARMPEGVTCKTFNAIGHATWQKHLGKFLKVDARKLWRLWNTYPHAQELADDAQDIVKLARLAKAFGLSPGYGPTPKTQALPSFELWQEIAEQFDIEESQALLPHALWLLVESNKLSWQSEIDFDDQLYCPIVYDSQFEKWDRVSVDEAQDLSALQHEMVERMLTKGGQAVIVGDPQQAIYSFRGASNDSFSELTERFHLDQMKLTVSFRCPEAVCQEARKYVPDIESGTGRTGSRQKVEVLELSKHLCIASRTNAPIIRLAFQGISRGIPVNYLGRDFMFGLKALDAKHPTLELLEKWKDSQLAAAKSLGAKQRVEDRYNSMLAIHQSAKEARISVKSAIHALCEEVKAGSAMTLGTIHRLKGAEHKNVAYLSYDKKWPGEQERNIKYVGLTRASESLTLQYDEKLNM